MYMFDTYNTKRGIIQTVCFLAAEVRRNSPSGHPGGWGGGGGALGSASAVVIADHLLDVVEFGLQVFTPTLLHLVVSGLFNVSYLVVFI